jgi:hypothetical protein
MNRMATSRSPPTIHIVKIVDGIDGSAEITRPEAASPAPSGCGGQTMCGVGNSSVPSIKQTGKAHDSPGCPPAGNGGTKMKARASMTSMIPISRIARRLGDRRRFGSEGAAGGRSESAVRWTASTSFAGMSLDTFAPDAPRSPTRT